MQLKGSMNLKSFKRVRILHAEIVFFKKKKKIDIVDNYAEYISCAQFRIRYRISKIICLRFL